MDTKTQIGILIFVIVGVAVALHYWRKIADDALRRSGVSTDATVLELKDTGRRLYLGPEVEVRVRYVANGKPMESVYRQPMSALDPVRLQPGSVVRVVYDPQKPSRVVRQQP